MEDHHRGLEGEGNRVLGRPHSIPPQVLTCFKILPLGNQSTYCKRLRRLIYSTVLLSKGQDFDREVLNDTGIPAWFVYLTDGVPSTDREIPDGAREGAAKYFSARGGDEWDLQEWLFMFDPQLRSWSWWDVTGGGNGWLFLYIDTKGEIPVPLEELWWAMFASGAQVVEGPFLVSPEKWAVSPSMGVVPAG